jgi:GrpB-like predicted nucleotidyltransferase (UPF0157 family)/predicted O-methyltransferase YrrM
MASGTERVLEVVWGVPLGSTGSPAARAEEWLRPGGEASNLGLMPFPDESSIVQLVASDPGWEGEFVALRSRLTAALGDLALRIDHVGSTSVPGLIAKNVIDVQISVASLDRTAIAERLTGIGFRLRPEPWNNSETTFGELCEKLTFAPPAGERAANVAVRIDGQPNARAALLCRDFLRADPDMRQAWGAFKTRVAEVSPDLAMYGHIKAPATEVLFRAANDWAEGITWATVVTHSNSPRGGNFGTEATSTSTSDVLERLVRDGIIVASRDGSVHTVFPVAVSPAEGDRLRAWVVRERATRTIEIGLGYGVSALFVCAGLLENGAPDARHVVIDPLQDQRFAGCGLQVLEEAGVAELVEYHAEGSETVLPRLLSEGRQFDLAFVDGNHRFDGVFVDLVYLGRLVRPGGILFVDDYQLPAVARAASFFTKNLGWVLEELSPADSLHQWAVLRTAEVPDTRPFDFFVNF